MKISAVYIAQNEEENISRSLESLKGLVDELILVDTGSVDDTVKIFQSYGGSVYHLSWSDDFSAPRNLAISKATGDWLILLDADEYFTYETVTNLRKVIEENLGYNGFYINITNINKITGEALDSFYTLRIVKKQKGLAYYGRIHEELLINGETIENAIFISKSLLNINHTGYTPEISEYKCRRNLKILKQELLEGYNPASLYTYFAECYDGIGDINNMLKYAWLDIEQGRRRVTYASRSYRKLIKYFAYNGTKFVSNNYKKDNALSNGSGKSFLWSGICYALTGETISGLRSNLKNM